MPNHVKNRVTAPKAVIEKLMSKDDKGQPMVDFNLIIPRPTLIDGGNICSSVKTAADIALGLVRFGDGCTAVPSDIPGWITHMDLRCAIRQLQEGPMVKDFSDEDYGAFLHYLQAYRECDGLMTWHDWQCEKWGTKWNGYDCERVNDEVVTFKTAWAAPHPVIAEMAKMAIIAEIKHEWADEDLGNNVGRRVYTGPKFVEEDLAQSLEAWDLIFDMGHADRNDYVLNGDRYNYKED